MRRLFRKSLPSEAQIRDWLGDHPLIARILSRSGFLGLHRRELARGVAVGLLVGLTPTVGMQTIPMILLCVILRASFPAAFLVSWISNPLTAPALYFAFNRLGGAVFGGDLGALPPTTNLAGEVARQTLYLVLGSALVAIPAALLGYGLFLAAWRYSVINQRRVAKRQRKERRTASKPHPIHERNGGCAGAHSPKATSRKSPIQPPPGATNQSDS